MPRTHMKKIDLEPRLHKLKTSLYSGQYEDKTGEWHDGAHYMLNQVLNILGEYRE